MRCDFVDDNRYVTDCGPTCRTVGCDCTLWVYLVGEDGQSVVGQCAACHGVEHFMLSEDSERAKLSISEIKVAHFHYAVHRRVTPVYERA
jgi:hypothetical protein